MNRRARDAAARLAQARFDGALHAEALGRHPGQVEVVLRAEIYHAGRQERVRVPGWEVRLLCATLDEVMGSEGACRAGLLAWLEGCVSEGCVVCPECGARVSPTKGRKK